ncbi:MAG: amidohydrolase family protein, partial [Alphaproteobacteria bacterium]
KRPNIAAKTSALPCYTTESYPFPMVHPHVQRILEAFGPDRVFWGTDMSRLSCDYRECVTLFTEEMPFLSGAVQEKVMGTGICDWLGWRYS